MKRFIKVVISFIIVFCMTACGNQNKQELACEQITTKMCNAILDGKVGTLEKIVSNDYRDGIGFLYFKKTIQEYYAENNANDSTKTRFNKLCKDIAKKALHSYTITHFEITPDNFYVFVSAKGVNFKNLYLKDYADDFAEAMDHYKKSSNHTYNMYVENEGQEKADQHILEEASADYFKKMRKKFDKYEEKNYNIRVSLKEKEGKLLIYRTDTDF